MANGGFALDLHVAFEIIDVEGGLAVSATRQTTTAAISTGLPRLSFTFSLSLMKLRARSEIFALERPVRNACDRARLRVPGLLARVPSGLRARLRE